MRRDRQRRRDHHLKAEAEAGAMQLQVRDVREWDPPPGARKRQQWIPPTTNYVLFRDTQFVILYYETLANQYRGPPWPVSPRERFLSTGSGLQIPYKVHLRPRIHSTAPSRTHQQQACRHPFLERGC